MPIKLKKTVSTSAVTGNSVLFNGTNQYLSIANNAAFNFGTGSFTIEGWINPTLIDGTYRCVFSIGNPVQIYARSGTLEIYFNDSDDTLTYIVFGANGPLNAITANTWAHFAVVRIGTTFTAYINGVAGTPTTGVSAAVASTSTGVVIGNILNTYPFSGYISNLRVVKGTALYTSNFTPSTSPLTAIANTSLLTCQSPTIIDNSTNNFTITNNNTATVSSAVVPFTTSFSVFKLKKNNATPVASYSVLFNGSNYLNCGSNALFSFGTGNFTVEGWMYLTTMGVYNTLFSNGTAVAGAVGLYTLGTNNKLSFAEYYGTDVNGSTTLSINTWYHVAVTRSGSTVRLFLNGNIENSNASDSFNNTTNNLVIGSAWGTAADGRMNGYISNFRIVKGTALYTASFTPSTSPLTAIANTSLLTCNAATIVDASSNNFTITNNNTATVSSTITPFTASISTNKFKLRHVSYSSAVSATQKAIFGYGYNGSPLSMTNLVSNTGVAATDTTGVGTARTGVAATGYGTDKAIFGYGDDGNSTSYSTTNLVSNAGVVATDTTGVGTARAYLAAAGYGTDKAIFAYGYTPSPATGYSISNLVSNTGVVATNTTGVGTARTNLAAAGYGSDKALFGYGYTTVNVSMTNLVSNTGVVATDTTGVGTARYALAAAGYGSDKAIFGYGRTTSNVSMTNLVSNTGVVSTDTTGVGTARERPAAAGYGSDKAIFGYGSSGGRVSMTNKVSNTGVVSTDTTGVGTAREQPAAAGYSLS